MMTFFPMEEGRQAWQEESDMGLEGWALLDKTSKPGP
jgi:hypothetical protein